MTVNKYNFESCLEDYVKYTDYEIVKRQKETYRCNYYDSVAQYTELQVSMRERLKTAMADVRSLRLELHTLKNRSFIEKLKDLLNASKKI